MSYVIFDIGGTKTRLAITEDMKTYSEELTCRTPINFEEGVGAIVDRVRKITDKQIRGVAGGIRGVLNSEKTELAQEDVLTDWVDKPLQKTLKKKLQADVFLENDAALAGLGEAHFGAGKGSDIVAYHTVSTGVGGVKIEHGQIDNYNVGFEPGRQVLDIDRTILGEEVVPTLQNLVSGTAVEERTGQKPYDIPQSDALWDQLAYYLAYGLRTTILYWSPDIIVLGGSMILGDPRIPLDTINKHTNEVMEELGTCPLIVTGELGDVAGLYGAMVRLREIF